MMNTLKNATNLRVADIDISQNAQTMIPQDCPANWYNNQYGQSSIQGPINIIISPLPAQST